MKASLNIPAQCKGLLWRHADPLRMHAMHRHDELEVNLVVRGSASYLLANRRYSLRARHVVWLFPDQDHLLLDKSSDFVMWIGVFGRNLLAECCASPGTRVLLERDPPGAFCRPVAAGAFAQLDRLCGELLGRGGDVSVFNAGLGYLLTRAWEAFSAGAVPADSADIHPAVEQAARLLSQQPQADDLRQLAQRVGLSVSQLSRVFRRQIGQSLVEFRNRSRLETFLHLYGQGHRRSALSAALSAGFGSYPQFHRVFRRLMGMSPAQYRRKLAGGAG